MPRGAQRRTNWPTLSTCELVRLVIGGVAWDLCLRAMVQKISWELFRKKFYVEYFLDNVRFSKEVQFLQSVQGGMLVPEYADRFKHLICFRTLAMDEEWQCKKFENGLRGDIKLLVAGLCIKEFPTFVERAIVLEKTKNEVESQQRHPHRVGGPVGPRATLVLWGHHTLGLPLMGVGSFPPNCQFSQVR